jgi:hypothetical protein
LPQDLAGAGARRDGMNGPVNCDANFRTHRSDIAGADRDSADGDGAERR